MTVIVMRFETTGIPLFASPLISICPAVSTVTMHAEAGANRSSATEAGANRSSVPLLVRALFALGHGSCLLRLRAHRATAQAPGTHGENLLVEGETVVEQIAKLLVVDLQIRHLRTDGACARGASARAQDGVT